MTGREEEEEKKKAEVSRDRRRVEETNGEGISFQMSQFHQGDSSPGSINRQACVKIQGKKKDAPQTVRSGSTCATPVPYHDAVSLPTDSGVDELKEAVKARMGRLRSS